MDINFKFQIEELGLEAESIGEPWRVLEEWRDRSEIGCRHDCVEGCLEGVNRRQEAGDHGGSMWGELWR